MSDMPVTPVAPQTPPWAPVPDARPPRARRALKLLVGLGAAAGVAVGATALIQGTSAGPSARNADATVTASSSPTTSTTLAPRAHSFGGAGRLGGGFGGPGGPGGFGGPAIYGQYTVPGPNGYETLAERTGTVSDVTDTSGTTWSLTVKSADGTSGTFTVDTGTSVDGGEMGIGSVKTGDTVRVVAVVSGATSTAKQVIDQTVEKANAGTWRPMGPQSGSNSSSLTPPGAQTTAPPV